MIGVVYPRYIMDGVEKTQPTNLGAGKDKTEFLAANPNFKQTGIGERLKELVKNLFGTSKPLPAHIPSEAQLQMAAEQIPEQEKKKKNLGQIPTKSIAAGAGLGITAGAVGIAAVASGAVGASGQEQPTPSPTSTPTLETQIEAAPSQTTPLTNIPPYLEGVRASDYVPGPITQEYMTDQHPAVEATEKAIRNNLTPGPTKDVGDPDMRATAQTYETLEAAGKLPTATSTPTSIPTPTPTPQPLEGFAKSQATAQAAETITGQNSPIDGAK